MKRFWIVGPIALGLTACAQGCAITKALYLAVVHNSGAPPKDERARIQQREDEMLRNLRDRRVMVLPMQILGQTVRHDTAAAQLLAARLREAGFGRVTASNRVVALPLERQPNELYIYWTRFRALSAAMAADPPSDADYVLVVDVLGRPESASVGAVHVMSVTARGDMAYGALWNSHQALYKEIQPRSTADAATMVVTAMTRRWTALNGAASAQPQPLRSRNP